MWSLVLLGLTNPEEEPKLNPYFQLMLNIFPLLVCETQVKPALSGKFCKSEWGETNMACDRKSTYCVWYLGTVVR